MGHAGHGVRIGGEQESLLHDIVDSQVDAAAVRRVDYEPNRKIVGAPFVSEYRAKDLYLRYAAKDAEDFGAALSLAAQGLLGADRTKVTVLSSASTAKEHLPNRSNILSALNGLRAVARVASVPDDRRVASRL